MLQQHIAAIRDIPLVGHDHDGNTKYMTASWNEELAKAIVTEVTSTVSEGLMRQLIESYKWLAAFRD